MFKKSQFAGVLGSLALGLAATASGATFLETFTSDPGISGWRVHGNRDLFNWDSAHGDLRVTWDSSKTNSYFHRPLGTVLARDDDFRLEFDLRLIDIGTGAKSGPFEIAIGFMNLEQATRDGFWRGSGINELHGPRNLVEFDYFPAGYYPGWGDVLPSVSPTLISRDNQFAATFTLVELTNGAVYHVILEFTTTNQTLQTSVLVNGSPFAPIDTVIVGTNFSDFRVDTVAIASYSDFGNDFDSVLAHGVIDNVLVTTPPPPVSSVAGTLRASTWEIGLLSRTNWSYTLERTEDLTTWTPSSESVMGNNGAITLVDRNPPNPSAYYRVRAERP